MCYGPTNRPTDGLITEKPQPIPYIEGYCSIHASFRTFSWRETVSLQQGHLALFAPRYLA